jgi:DNA-nicking Smr family endonuclease
MSWFRRLLGAAFPEAGPEVDLHGLRVPEALAAVEQALGRAETRGALRLRIVCGKGRGSPGGVGVLREAVAGWLDAHGYAGRYQRQVDRDGRDGAIWVDLGKNRP